PPPFGGDASDAAAGQPSATLMNVSVWFVLFFAMVDALSLSHAAMRCLVPAAARARNAKDGDDFSHRKGGKVENS
ncbi:MAG: hypothetical protein FWH47_04925, partial [Methanomassiliicoccaceae archaeon]|nr:hypothetical protein [Methanomassiliicoccaceae archaeon]